MAIKSRIKFRVGVLKALYEHVLSRPKKEVDARVAAAAAANPDDVAFANKYNQATALMKDIEQKLAQGKDPKGDLQSLAKLSTELGEYDLNGHKPAVLDDLKTIFEKYFQVPALNAQGRPAQNALMGEVETMLEKIESSKGIITDKEQKAVSAFLTDQSDRFGDKAEEVQAALVDAGVDHAEAAKKAGLLFQVQQEELVRLLEETNKELDKRKEAQIVKALTERRLRKMLGEDFNPDEMDSYTYDTTGVGRFQGKRGPTKKDLEGMSDFEKAKAVLLHKAKHKLGDHYSHILGSAFTFEKNDRGGYKIKATRYSGPGMGFTTRGQQLRALKTLIMALADKARSEGKDPADKDLILDVPAKLASEVMKYAMQAGFSPSNVYSEYEYDKLQKGAAYVEKRSGQKNDEGVRHYGGFRGFQGLAQSKDWQEEIERIKGGQLQKHVLNKYDKAKAAPTGSKLTMRKGDPGVIQRDSTAPALILEADVAPPNGPQPPQLTAAAKLIFFDASSAQQAEWLSRASAKQLSAILFSEAPALSVSSRADIFKNLSPDQQAEVLGWQFIENVQETFPNPKAASDLVQGLDEKQAFALFQAITDENSALRDRVLAQRAQAIPLLAKHYVHSLPPAIQGGVIALAAKQNYLGLAVGPRKEARTAQQPAFSLAHMPKPDEIAAAYRKAGAQGVLVDPAEIAQILDRVAGYANEGENKPSEMAAHAFSVVNQCFNRENNSPLLADVLNEMAHPERFVDFYLSERTNAYNHGVPHDFDRRGIKNHLLTDVAVEPRVKAVIAGRLLKDVAFKRAQAVMPAPAQAFTLENGENVQYLGAFLQANPDALVRARALIEISDPNEQIALFRLMRGDHTEAFDAAPVPFSQYAEFAQACEVLNEIRDPAVLGRLLNTHRDAANKLEYDTLVAIWGARAPDPQWDANFIQGLLAENKKDTREVFQSMLAAVQPAQRDRLLTALSANFNQLDQDSQDDLLNELLVQRARARPVQETLPMLAAILKQQPPLAVYADILNVLPRPADRLALFQQLNTLPQREAFLTQVTQRGMVPPAQARDIAALLAVPEISIAQRDALLKRLPQAGACARQDVMMALLKMPALLPLLAQQSLLADITSNLPVAKRAEMFARLLKDPVTVVHAKTFFETLIKGMKGKPALDINDVATMLVQTLRPGDGALFRELWAAVPTAPASYRSQVIDKVVEKAIAAHVVVGLNDAVQPVGGAVFADQANFESALVCESACVEMYAGLNEASRGVYVNALFARNIALKPAQVTAMLLHEFNARDGNLANRLAQLDGLNYPPADLESAVKEMARQCVQANQARALQEYLVRFPAAVALQATVRAVFNEPALRASVQAQLAVPVAGAPAPAPLAAVRAVPVPPPAPAPRGGPAP